VQWRASRRARRGALPAESLIMTATATPTLDEAIQFYEEKQYAAAEELFGALYADCETRPQAAYGLGLIAFVREQLEDSFGWFLLVPEFSTRYADAQHYLALIEQMRGDRAAALKHCTACLAAKPHHSGAQELMSRLNGPVSSRAVPLLAPHLARVLFAAAMLTVLTAAGWSGVRLLSPAKHTVSRSGVVPADTAVAGPAAMAKSSCQNLYEVWKSDPAFYGQSMLDQLRQGGCAQYKIPDQPRTK